MAEAMGILCTPPGSGEARGAQSPAPSWWAALLDDTGSFVGVVDAGGQLHFANRAATRLLTGSDRNSLVGSRLEDLFSQEFAAEWRRLIRHVLDTTEPLIYQSVVRGAAVLITMRALEGDSNRPPLVLGVSRPYLHSSFLNNSEEERIVARAKIMDLGPLSSLTQRELEVLALIGEGLSTAEIAKRLSRSTKTVEWHRTSLGRKLEASNRVELAHIAIRAGLADFLALDTPRGARHSPRTRTAKISNRQPTPSPRAHLARRLETLTAPAQRTPGA